MDEKLIKTLIGDKYDREAVLLPALISVGLIAIAQWNRIILAINTNSILDSTIATWAFLVCFVICIKMYMWVVRTTSKRIVETFTYGKDRSGFPTVTMLLPTSTILSKTYKERICIKAKEDFGITIPTEKEIGNDENNAKKEIAEIANLIRRKVSKSPNADMYQIKNIRYGRVRNMIAGCGISFLGDIATLFYSLTQGESIFSPICCAMLSFCISLYAWYLYKKAGVEYAKELFDNYLISK